MINARRALVNSGGRVITNSRIQINANLHLPHRVRVTASRPLSGDQAPPWRTTVQQRTTSETFLPALDAKDDSGAIVLVGCEQVRGPPLFLSWKWHHQHGDLLRAHQGLSLDNHRLYHHFYFSGQGEEAQGDEAQKEEMNWNGEPRPHGTEKNSILNLCPQILHPICFFLGHILKDL